jgi:hypothetical protein
MPRSEIKIQNKNVSTEGDNKSSYYVLYIRQVWYSLADVNKGNTQVIIKKVHHSVER